RDGNAKSAKGAKKNSAQTAPVELNLAVVPKKISLRGLCALYALCALCVLSVSCSNTSLFRQYEYEEDLYLALDGTATVYVNSSIAALNALRGSSFDASPASRVDTNAIRAYYTASTIHVTRVSPFRRSGRRFVSVRLDVDDIRTLSAAAPF